MPISFARRLLAPLAIAFVIAAGGTPAAAQDDAMVALGESIWKTKALCRDCHGWLADGVPENHQSPKGANLRHTALTGEQLAEVIKCGRPGVPMPYYDRRAYDDGRCFGLTAADLGDDTPPPGRPFLTPREIGALSAFITARFKDRGEPTFEECIAFWGEGASTCIAYPKEADGPGGQAGG